MVFAVQIRIYMYPGRNGPVTNPNRTAKQHVTASIKLMADFHRHVSVPVSVSVAKYVYP